MEDVGGLVTGEALYKAMITPFLAANTRPKSVGSRVDT
jgi:hypothetical protein